jgi:hypothetical protein
LSSSVNIDDEWEILSDKVTSIHKGQQIIQLNKF